MKCKLQSQLRAYGMTANVTCTLLRILLVIFIEIISKRVKQFFYQKKRGRNYSKQYYYSIFRPDVIFCFNL